jgi:hypothetical protein
MTDNEFLYEVSERCKRNPSLLSLIIGAAVGGIDQNAKEANQRAIDMEVLASVMFGMMKKSRIGKNTRKWFAKLAESKLERWHKKGELRCIWEDLEDLQGKKSE